MKLKGGELLSAPGTQRHTHGRRAKRQACMGLGEAYVITRRTTHHAGGGYEGGEADVQVQHPTPYSGRDMILAIGLKPTEAGGQGKHGMGCLLEERRT